MCIRILLASGCILIGLCACGGDDPTWLVPPREYCPPATIADPSPGFCAERETCDPIGDTPCTEDGVPMCGCDGRTYADDCARRRAGVTRDHSGSCGSGDPCGPESPCADPAEYCETTGGRCDDTGVCVARIPDVCVGRPEPVCGCNGESFQNDCLRRAAGVARARQGECEGDLGECELVPPAGCCFEDGDCESGICLGGCWSGGAGTCVEPATEGRCWTWEDCGAGEECFGAAPCVCGWTCDFQPGSGWCQPIEDEGD